MQVHKVKKYIYPVLHVLPAVFMLWLTVQPVEMRWAEADVWLSLGLPLMGGLCLLAILGSSERCRFTVTDGLVTAWTLYYLGRVWVGAEYPCAKEWLQTMEVAVMYAVLRMLFHGTKVQSWMLCAGIMLAGCYEAIIGVSQLVAGQGRHHLFALTGTFQNPGPYSAYLMMAGVLAISPEPASVMNRSRWRWLFCLPLLLLPATWSRAALVGFGACALWIYRAKYWKYRWVVWISLMVLAAGFYFLKRGSADGRTLIWMATLTSWLHAPWLGVGIGGFCHACAEGMAEMWHSFHDETMFVSAGVTDYAYNSLIKILAEQGIAGASLCVSVTSIAMWRLRKVSKPLFMSMLSLLIFSMFSYPFELLPYKIILVMVVAWSESKQGDTLCFRMGRMSSSLACTASIAVGIYLYGETSARNQIDKETMLFSTMHNAAFIDDYYELMPYETGNPHFLFDFAKTLREDKRYRDSNAILRQGTLVSADPMFYIIMGNNYRDEQYYDLAEEAYMKAFAVMPNRLYPIYQLMLLYEESGEKKKCEETARRVMWMKPKVESPATRDMQRKASERLTPAI